MRDDVTFVERLRRDLRDVRWPEPTEIRARARRRSLRTALAAAAAVLVVASGSAVAVAAHRAPSTPPSTGSAPSRVSPSLSSLPASPEPTGTAWTPAEVPLDVLLGPADLRTKSEPLTQAGLGEGVSIAEGLLYCHKFQGLAVDWELSRYSRSVTLLKERPAGADHPPSDLVLTQDVYRVAPDVGGRLFAGIDQVLAPCETWRASGPTQWRGKMIQAQVTHRWQVVDRNFAGTESVLLRHTISQAQNLKTGRSLGALPAPDSTAVVRVGDLVSVITLGRAGSESDLRRLTAVAAKRMCPAANPRC